MKRIKHGLMAILLLLGLSHGLKIHRKASDSYLRDRVVKLTSPTGQCTGVMVKAPSGKTYVLTARHCKGLLVDGKMMATLEDGRKYLLSVVATDTSSDLMLLSQMSMDGIEVAEHVYVHEPVHSMTHGHGFPSYRTDGELLEELDLTFPESLISTKQDYDVCIATPGHVAQPGFFGIMLCALKLTNMATTAKIVPGSSGGPIVDSSGRLVGIVSAGDDLGFGYLVPLRNIQSFLKSR